MERASYPTTSSVVTASGRTEQLSLRTAIDNFRLENFPEFKTESFTVPSEIVGIYSIYIIGRYFF